MLLSIGLEAIGVAPILAKVLQMSHTHTRTHQAKTVGSCIGLEATGATWCRSPLSLQRSCALIKLRLCLGAQVLAMLARHSVQRQSTVECCILTWRPDVCCWFTLRFTLRMQVLGQKCLKETSSHSVDRHRLEVADCSLQQHLPCTMEGRRAMLYDPLSILRSH